MLQCRWRAFPDGASVKGKMDTDIRICMICLCHDFKDIKVNVQLFPAFTAQGLGACFTGLDLAAGEFPAILEGAVAALGRKNAATFPDDRGHHLYRLRKGSSPLASACGGRVLLYNKAGRLTSGNENSQKTKYLLTK